jgi:hypothetical protein
MPMMQRSSIGASSPVPNCKVAGPVPKVLTSSMSSPLATR